MPRCNTTDLPLSMSEHSSTIVLSFSFFFCDATFWERKNLVPKKQEDPNNAWIAKEENHLYPSGSSFPPNWGIPKTLSRRVYRVPTHITILAATDGTVVSAWHRTETFSACSTCRHWTVLSRHLIAPPPLPREVSWKVWPNGTFLCQIYQEYWLLSIKHLRNQSGE